jgi:hypothetical protein
MAPATGPSEPTLFELRLLTLFAEWVEEVDGDQMMELNGLRVDESLCRNVDRMRMNCQMIDAKAASRGRWDGRESDVWGKGDQRLLQARFFRERPLELAEL